MKIEIRKFNETDDYILHVPTVKIDDGNKNQKIFLDSSFTSEAGLIFIFHNLELAFPESLFTAFMLETKTIQLITWASCIAEYSYKYPYGCPFWSKENDLIWEKLIEFGIVELKDVSKK